MRDRGFSHRKVAIVVAAGKLRFYKTVLKAALALGVLAFLLYHVEPGAILATALAAEPGWIVAALALLPLNLLLEATGWHLLARHVAPEARRREALGSVLAGHALGLATPARLGEFAGRALSLPGGRRGMLVGLVFAHRLAALVVGVGLGLAAFLSFLATHTPTPSALWTLAACYGAATGGIVALGLLFPRHLYHLLGHLGPAARIRRHVRFLTTLRTRRMAALLGLEALRYGVYTSQFVLLLAAFAPGFAWPTAYLGVALVYYAKYLLPPVALFDLGIREGAAVFFLARLGLPEAAAFDAALLLFGINLLLSALLGTPFLLRLQRKHEVGRPGTLAPAHPA